MYTALKNNTAQLKVIRFHGNKRNMKVMGIMNHSIKKIAVFLHHHLNPVPDTAAGLRHGVRVEVAHHLFDRHHQGGDSVVVAAKFMSVL